MEEHKEKYLLDNRDRQIVRSAITLLQKMCCAPFVKSSQLVSISKALHVFSALPDITEDINLTIDLSGPRQWYGDHEIWHWWQVLIEPYYIEISSGGNFYRKSTGSDSFTCMQWTAQPGFEAEYSDYLYSLSIVDDAKPFEPEVEQMDLSEPGYSIEVTDEDNLLLDEDETDAIDDEEDLGESVQDRNPADAELDVLADLQEGHKRGETHANPPSSCDICNVDLSSKKYFVDGKQKNSMIWANMCSNCFL